MNSGGYPIDGAKLRAARERARMSRPQLAAAVEVSAAYISMLEAGVRRPRIGVLGRLEDALGVPMGAFNLDSPETEGGATGA